MFSKILPSIILISLIHCVALCQDFSKNPSQYTKFNEAEISFISDYFRTVYKEDAESYENILTENITEDYYDIHPGGAEEMAASSAFSLYWNKSLIASLGEANNQYKFFHVSANGGGNANWTEIYAMKLSNDIPNSVFQIDVPCPFNSPNGCNDSPLLTKIDNNILLFNIGFVGPNDGECCPSWEYEVAYKFQTNKLTLVSKKKVKQLQN
jgi:hypothetical protein